LPFLLKKEAAARNGGIEISKGWNVLNDKKKEYFEQAERDSDIQRCAFCGELGTKSGMDRHHTSRRLGGNILKYVYLHRPCHNMVENNSNLARRLGLRIDDNSNELNISRSLKDGENMLGDNYEHIEE